MRLQQCNLSACTERARTDRILVWRMDLPGMVSCQLSVVWLVLRYHVKMVSAQAPTLRTGGRAPRRRFQRAYRWRHQMAPEKLNAAAYIVKNPGVGVDGRARSLSSEPCVREIQSCSWSISGEM
jgi:hypothetical protein